MRKPMDHVTTALLCTKYHVQERYRAYRTTPRAGPHDETDALRFLAPPDLPYHRRSVSHAI